MTVLTVALELYPKSHIIHYAHILPTMNYCFPNLIVRIVELSDLCILVSYLYITLI